MQFGSVVIGMGLGVALAWGVEMCNERPHLTEEVVPYYRPLDDQSLAATDLICMRDSQGWTVCGSREALRELQEEGDDEHHR